MGRHLSYKYYYLDSSFTFNIHELLFLGIIYVSSQNPIRAPTMPDVIVAFYIHLK